MITFSYYTHLTTQLFRLKSVPVYIAALTLIISGLFPRQFANAQTDPSQALELVTQAISGGDVDLITKYIGTYTEISILGASTTYSQAQTTYILKAFFRDHPPERANFQNRIQVGNDWYFRGKYWNKDKKQPYRLEMTMRWNGNQYKIKSIVIKAPSDS